LTGARSNPLRPAEIPQRPLGRFLTWRIPGLPVQLPGPHLVIPGALGALGQVTQGPERVGLAAAVSDLLADVVGLPVEGVRPFRVTLRAGRVTETPEHIGVAVAETDLLVEVAGSSVRFPCPLVVAPERAASPRPLSA
jgi:hypothetical protein